MQRTVKAQFGMDSGAIRAAIESLLIAGLLVLTWAYRARGRALRQLMQREIERGNAARRHGAS